MTTLVVGASGATGKHLVKHLLDKGHSVKVIVRSSAKISDAWKNHKDLQIIEANVLEISEDEMAEHLKDCEAAASCLGHNMNWKGLFGEPRRLVTDAVRLIYNAIKKNEPNSPTKFVLMNTTGYVNNELNEPNSLIQKIVIWLLRLLLPPHVDNEKAAGFLWTNIGQNDRFMEWVSLRPYGLIDKDNISEYEVYASPSKPAVFDSKKARRINVGHFMAELIIKNDLWDKWKGQMPVIFDKDESK